MEQRRVSTRLRTLLEGRVVFNNRFSLIECTVRDISESGAQIMFAHPVRIPLEVELEIPKRNLNRHARLVWSNGRAHGLAFTDAPGQQTTQATPTTPPAPEPQPAPSDQPLAPSFAEVSVREILDEARSRLADNLGVSIDAIKLKLAVEY